MKNITELEQLVINTITNGESWYEIPHMTVSEISEETEIPMEKLRGVLSSLEQKGIIQESELSTCTVWMVCEQSTHHRNKITMKNINEIIADLSINIACLLDEPSEVTKQDLIDLQDAITALEN
jgi:predicted transcriptional regulator